MATSSRCLPPMIRRRRVATRLMAALVKSTMHWVSAAHSEDATVALYERLFTAEAPGERTGEGIDDLNPASRELLSDAKVERALGDAAPGEVVQFERLGYFAADLDSPMLFHRTVGLRDEWASIQKRGCSTFPTRRCPWPASRIRAAGHRWSAAEQHEVVENPYLALVEGVPTSGLRLRRDHRGPR